MEEELLNKLKLFQNNFDLNDLECLQDFLYIIYLNITQLNWLNDDINKIILEIFSQIFYKKIISKNKNILSNFISTRLKKLNK